MIKAFNEKEKIEKIAKAIIATDFFKECVVVIPQEIENDIETYTHPNRYTEYLIQIVGNFFTGNIAEMLEVQPLFELVKEELNIDIHELEVESKQDIVNISEEHDEKIQVERSLTDIIEDIEKAVEKMYEAQLDSLFAGQTVEKIKGTEQSTRVNLGLDWKPIPSMVYVAVLDKNDKLTREPFPVLSRKEHPDVKVSAALVKEEIPRNVWRIQASFDQPITEKSLAGESVMSIRSLSHIAKPNEVKVEVYET